MEKVKKAEKVVTFAIIVAMSVLVMVIGVALIIQAK
jgi:hypothetical protein